jgi:hypothetical protein
MSPLGRAKVQIHLEQLNETRSKGLVNVRKIWIGPFATKTIAENVLNKIREFNRKNSGRGLHPKIEKLEGKSETITKSYYVMYGDTVTAQTEKKKEKKKKENPYEWYLELIPYLCSTVLKDVSPAEFTTNIESIQGLLLSKFSSYDDDSDDEDNEPAPKIKSASKTETKPKKVKLNAEQIMVMKEAKKQARQAEKIALEERKKAAKKIKSTVAPATVAPAPAAPSTTSAAPTQVKPVTKARYVNVERKENVEVEIVFGYDSDEGELIEATA